MYEEPDDMTRKFADLRELNADLRDTEERLRERRTIALRAAEKHLATDHQGDVANLWALVKLVMDGQDLESAERAMIRMRLEANDLLAEIHRSLSRRIVDALSIARDADADDDPFDLGIPTSFDIETN